MKTPSFVFFIAVAMLTTSCVVPGPRPRGVAVESQVGVYSTLPAGYRSPYYYYGNRYYYGGRWETGRYTYLGRQYDGRYFHNGRYIYGGRYHGDNVSIRTQDNRSSSHRGESHSFRTSSSHDDHHDGRPDMRAGRDMRMGDGQGPRPISNNGPFGDGPR